MPTIRYLLLLAALLLPVCPAIAQRHPTPAQSGIDSMTPETYWTGGFSAFGVDLVKAGYEVETLPVEGSITYGDGGNAQDLSNYDVLILPEPNAAYTAAESDD